MSKSVLKTFIIYITTIIISSALSIMLILFPTYIHYAAVYVPGAYDTLYMSKYSPYDTIVIEVDYQSGMEPDPYAIDALQQQIELHSGKNVVIHLSQDIENNEIPDVIYKDEIFNLASRLQDTHRDHRTQWLYGNITLYILYLDTVWHPTDSKHIIGSELQPEDATTNTMYSVGLTYAADSFIIFKDFIIDNNMETSVLLHEMGHIWGLNHSDNSNNVMNSVFDITRDSHTSNDSHSFEFPTNFTPENEQHLASLYNSFNIKKLSLLTTISD